MATFREEQEAVLAGHRIMRTQIWAARYQCSKGAAQEPGRCDHQQQAHVLLGRPCCCQSTHGSCNTLSWAAPWGCTTLLRASSDPVCSISTASDESSSCNFLIKVGGALLLALSAQVIFRCQWFVSKKCFIFACEGCSLKSVCFSQPVLKIIRRSAPKSVWYQVIQWCEKCDIANL